jgi:hypothetical protein
MYNNLYSKDPFGVFNQNIPPSDKIPFSNQHNSNYPFSNPSESTSTWKTIWVCLLIIGFGAILYFKEILVDGFKKIVFNVNDKLNPDLKEEVVKEKDKVEPKLLMASNERKVECILNIKDKANWDFEYINKKKEERKAIYTEGIGWTIYE